MTNEVVNKGAGGLAGLASGLRRTQKAMPSFGSKNYLSFGKDGMWTLGRDKRTDLTGDRVVMNVHTISAGFVCWTNHPQSSGKKNEKLGEEMRLITMGQIDPSQLPELGWEWKMQQSVEGRFLLGDQEEFVFQTSSNGGLEMMDTIINAIANRVEEGEEVHIFPVVELDSDFYIHKQYGKTYKPMVKIVAWADTDGEIEDEVGQVEDKSSVDTGPEQQDEPADQAPANDEDAPPVRRRRRG